MSDLSSVSIDPFAVRGGVCLARLALLCVMFSLLDVSTLLAQTGGPGTDRIAGPFAGLFGGGGRAENSQRLDLRASIFGLEQRVHVPDDVDLSLLNPSFQRDGRFAGVQSGLTYGYARSTENSTVSVGANASISDFSVTPERPQWGTGTSANLSTRLTRRTSFQSTGALSYGSTFNFSPIGTAGIGSYDPALGSALGFPTLDLNFLAGFATVGVSHNLSQRASVSVNLQAQRSFFFSNEQSDLASLGSTALFNYRVLRRLSFFAGYNRQQQLRLGTDRDPQTTQGALFGLNYGDALTLRLARRTTLSTNIGLGSWKSLSGQTTYTALGSVGLNHSMARTWSTGISFSRSLGFVAAFDNAVLSDSITAFLGGQLARRVSFTASAGYARGYVGLDTSQSFDSYTAMTGLNIALNRRMSAFTQASYYGNKVPPNTSTLPLLTTFDRSAVVVGVAFFAPLYSNPRVRR